MYLKPSKKSAYTVIVQPAIDPETGQRQCMVIDSQGNCIVDSYGNILNEKAGSGQTQTAGIQEAIQFVDALGGGTVYIKSGTYYPKALILPQTQNGFIRIKGGANTVIDFSQAPPIINPMINANPSNPFGYFVVYNINPNIDLQFSIENIIFQNSPFCSSTYSSQGTLAGVGGIASYRGFKNVYIRNIVMRNACHLVGFQLVNPNTPNNYENINIENIYGDTNNNIVGLWGGQYVGVNIKNVIMRPNLITAPSYSVDDTISLNPSPNTDNYDIQIEDVIGDYSQVLGSFQFASSTQLGSVGAVIDFAGFGGQSWYNAHSRGIYGLWAAALNVTYGAQNVEWFTLEDFVGYRSTVFDHQSGFAFIVNGNVNHVRINNGIIVAGTQKSNTEAILAGGSINDVEIGNLQIINAGILTERALVVSPGSNQRMTNVRIHDLMVYLDLSYYSSGVQYNIVSLGYGGSGYTFNNIYLHDIYANYGDINVIYQSPITLSNIYLSRIKIQQYINSFDLELLVPSLPANPPASGTLYQNNNFVDIYLLIPVTLQPSATESATATLQIGPSPSSLYTVDQVTAPAGLTSGLVYTLKAKIPVGWYYVVTVSNATIGTATVLPQGYAD